MDGGEGGREEQGSHHKHNKIKLCRIYEREHLFIYFFLFFSLFNLQFTLFGVCTKENTYLSPLYFRLFIFSVPYLTCVVENMYLSLLYLCLFIVEVHVIFLVLFPCTVLKSHER